MRPNARPSEVGVIEPEAVLLYLRDDSEVRKSRIVKEGNRSWMRRGIGRDVCHARQRRDFREHIQIAITQYRVLYLAGRRGRYLWNLGLYCRRGRGDGGGGAKGQHHHRA